VTLALHAAIPNAMLGHLATFASQQSPAIAVSWPDVSFSPPNGQPYLEAVHVPNRSETIGIADDAHALHEGFLQVAVMWPAGSGGLIAATNLAGEILSHFAKGTKLEDSDVIVKIDRSGWVVPYLQEATHIRLPVLIPYVCFGA
jgi:hypothetical protein